MVCAVRGSAVSARWSASDVTPSHKDLLVGASNSTIEISYVRTSPRSVRVGGPPVMHMSDVDDSVLEHKDMLRYLLMRVEAIASEESSMVDDNGMLMRVQYISRYWQIPCFTAH